MIRITKTNWRQILCGVPQKWIVGSILPNLFINDVEDGAECILCKFTDDTKLDVLLIGEKGVLSLRGFRN